MKNIPTIMFTDLVGRLSYLQFIVINNPTVLYYKYSRKNPEKTISLKMKSAMPRSK